MLCAASRQQPPRNGFNRSSKGKGKLCFRRQDAGLSITIFQMLKVLIARVAVDLGQAKPSGCMTALKRGSARW
jgi:hypothetical protein